MKILNKEIKWGDSVLNEKEKKYLSSTRLSIKINYVELNNDYEDNDIFYCYGNHFVISTINGETYIDKNYYKGDLLVNLLNGIFSCLDTSEIILPEEFFDVDIVNRTFFNLNCKEIIVDGKKSLTLEQLDAINNSTDIKELKVQSVTKNIGNKKFNFRIIPNISNDFTSDKFNNFIIDDILRLKTLEIELPLKDDYLSENDKNISERQDLQKIIDVLIDIDSFSLTILDDGSKSINQSKEIINSIEESIGSKIENIYFIIGNRDIENIEVLQELSKNHKLSILYDKEIICSIDDFINMRYQINKIVNPIKKFELSPLEKTLFAYDIVKDFYIVNSKYIKDKKVTRYIHRIFKVNSLNCQAYSALFAQILKELKIQASDYFLYSPLVEEVFLTKNNHSRTIVHLVDEKYSVDGLFSTDIIWDAIKKIKNNYHYEFFLTRVLTIKKQFSKDIFHNDIEILLNDKKVKDLNIKELQFFERLLNKNFITDSDIEYLRSILPNNISLKIFLHALSAVRVAQGRNKQNIKEELVAVVNRTSKKEKYIDKFYNAEEDLKYLDITLPN